MKWREVALGDHVELVTGYPFKSAEYENEQDGFYRLLRGDNIGQGVLRWDGARFWPSSKGEYYKTMRLAVGDVVLAMDRPWIGAGLKWSVVRRNDVPALLVQRVARLRGRDTLLQSYLPYVVASAAFTNHVQAITTGVNVPHISGRDIKAFRFPIPSPAEQRHIASILSAYDDLIEVNRRRVVILEEMARRLFEEWFVHLRFPGHEAVPVHDTPDAPLPEGWECRPLGQLVTEKRDTVLPSDLHEPTMYVGLEHIPRRSTTLTDWGRAEDVISAKLRFQRGDILFGKIRPYFHKVAVAPAHGVSSTDAIVLRSRAPQHAGIVAAVAASDAFVAHAVQTSNGTKMPRANWTVLARYLVRLPPEPLLDQFNSFVVNGINHAISLAAVNNRLAAARDLLLPRLVSGEISVANAPTPDRLLEAAD